MTIEQAVTIAHPFMLGHILHDAASRCIIQDGRSKKFHLRKFGHLEFRVGGTKVQYARLIISFMQPHKLHFIKSSDLYHPAVMWGKCGFHLLYNSSVLHRILRSIIASLRVMPQVA